MSDTDKIRERMLKMLALARNEAAAPGEADTASRMLDNLLKKHGMTLEDLTGEQSPQAFAFTHKGGADERLLYAVLRRVINSYVVRVRTFPGGRKIEADITPLQRMEVEALMSVWRPALHKHLHTAEIAFRLKNQIEPDDYPDTPPPEDEKRKPMDLNPAELSALMRATPVTTPHKQIEA